MKAAYTFVQEVLRQLGYEDKQNSVRIIQVKVLPTSKFNQFHRYQIS